VITLSTRELLGLLGDALPFVSTDKDDVTHNCVRVEWSADHERLFMMATNRVQAVRTWWDPDFEEVDSEETFLYGTDGTPPFSVRVPTINAKSIVSAFKLADKLAYAPVTLTVIPDNVVANISRLKIERAAAGDLWPALTMHVTGRGAPIAENGDPNEIDIHGVIDRIGSVPLTGVLGVALSPKLLGNFAKVERHGAMLMNFSSNAPGAPVFVRMGVRFDGITYQMKVDRA